MENGHGNMPFNSNGGQYNPNNGQYNPNNGQYNPNNGQYNPNNGQYNPNNGQYNPNNGQYDPNNMQYGYNQTQDQNTSYTYNLEPQQSGNSVLAIIGAILGAMIGGALWVLIYQIGYIVGIVGLLTFFLAMKGYELLGKKNLTKKSGITVLVVTLVVIFLAEYISFVLLVKKQFGEYLDYTFLQSFSDTWDIVMGYGENKLRFFKDIAFGYVFSIATFSSFYRNGFVLSKKR